MSEQLVFKVFSGGTISIDLDNCPSCQSKACIKVCNGPSGSKVLKLENGVPALQKTREAIIRGGCNECLGCELACRFLEENTVDINLPIKGFENYLEEIEKNGKTMIYNKKWSEI